MRSQPSGEPIDRGTWLALSAMGIAVFVIANDFSAINVAIPQIEQDFDTSVTTAQWVVNAYALVFGVRSSPAAGSPTSSAAGARSSSAAAFPRCSLCSPGRPDRGRADRDAGADGDRRGADVAGDPRNDLRSPPGGARRAGRRLHSRRRRHRQCRRAPDRWRADRPAQLALDLLPQRPGDRVRRLRHPRARSTSRGPRSRTHGSTTGASPPCPWAWWPC